MVFGDGKLGSRSWSSVALRLAIAVSSLALLPACRKQTRETSAPSRSAGLRSQVHEGIVLADVVDVRRGSLVPNGPTQVIGSVIGTGFQPGDTVLINGHIPAATAFGNSRWMSFSFPNDAALTHLDVCIVRPSTGLHSPIRTVRFREKKQTAK